MLKSKYKIDGEKFCLLWQRSELKSNKYGDDMRKRELRIFNYINPKGSNTLYIDNIGFYPEIINKLIFEIVNKFIQGDELFVGLYKTDGVNISRKEFKKLGEELEEYFKINNNYYLFTQSKNKNIKIISNDLIACKLVKDDKTSDMLLKFSDYFLETVFFLQMLIGMIY